MQNPAVNRQPRLPLEGLVEQIDFTLGIFLLAIGLSGLFWVILASLRIRSLENGRDKFDPNELNNKLLTISKVHMISISCAFFGFILLIAGIFLVNNSIY